MLKVDPHNIEPTRFHDHRDLDAPYEPDAHRYDEFVAREFLLHPVTDSCVAFVVRHASAFQVSNVELVYATGPGAHLFYRKVASW